MFLKHLYLQYAVLGYISVRPVLRGAVKPQRRDIRRNGRVKLGDPRLSDELAEPAPAPSFLPSVRQDERIRSREHGSMERVRVQHVVPNTPPKDLSHLHIHSGPRAV